VERNVDGKAVPLALLIKAANRKCLMDIDKEIKAALRHQIATERDYILSDHAFARSALTLYYNLPQFVRVWIWKLIFRNPFRAKEHSGTVMVTTVNAVGPFSGWIVPTRSMHGLSFALGTITRKPWVHGGQIEQREILNRIDGSRRNRWCARPAVHPGPDQAHRERRSPAMNCGHSFQAAAR